MATDLGRTPAGAWTIAAFGLAGCAAPTDPVLGGDRCAPGLEIGVAAGEGYVVVGDGDELPVERGAQGGWHVVGAVWVSGTTDVVTVDWTVWHEASGAVVGGTRLATVLQAYDGCAGEALGVVAWVDVAALADGEADTPPELLAGEALRLSARVTDEQGTSLSADVRTIAVVEE